MKLIDKIDRVDDIGNKNKIDKTKSTEFMKLTTKAILTDKLHKITTLSKIQP